MKNILKRSVILPLIVALAVALVVFKVKTKPPISHEKLAFPTRTVKVISARKIPFRPRAIAYGNVEPAILLKAKAEVSGKISYLHPHLKKGDSIAAGEVVLRIDPTTFEFSREQSKAGLAGSHSSLKQLQTEERSTVRSLKIARENLRVGEKELARVRKIWDKRLIARSAVDAEEQKVLQLRQQVEELQGKLDSFASRKATIESQIKQSKTQLQQSEDTLGRTTIRLPFNARIGDVFVDKDEFVPTGGVLFEALGTEAVEIAAQLPTRQFRPLLMGLDNAVFNLENPQGLQDALQQLQLQVQVRLVGEEGIAASWQGQLLRIGESIDPLRDTISLVVAVNKPYEGVIPGTRPPLLKGMYTAVEFVAPAQAQWVVPRKAIHQGRVYLASKENRLEIRPVTVLHRQGDLVVLGEGLDAGDRVIVTDVIPVIEGLPLKVIEDNSDAEVLRNRAAGTKLPHIPSESEAQP